MSYTNTNSYVCNRHQPNLEQLMQIAETMDKYIDMKIRVNEYHVNLFTNGRVQLNLCNLALIITNLLR